MTLRLAFVMDHIGSIDFKKDTTLAMLRAAQVRGWSLFHVNQADLFLRENNVGAVVQSLEVRNDPDNWFDLGDPQQCPLSDMDVVLMRKDPPFDMDFIYTTYLLELAGRDGTLIVNDPRSLRDCNEKLFTAWFPQCTPETVVSARPDVIREFLDQHEDIIVKPLDSMGGSSVFRIARNDPNRNVIIETLTQQETRQAMAQRYIPEISAGDKRIILIDGEPVPYALARIPARGETRANLATGGKGEGIPLSDRDRWICEQVGPELRRRGLMFVGLDVIGDFLTEINVTSPTGVRQLDTLFDLDISSLLMDAIETKRANSSARPTR